MSTETIFNDQAGNAITLLDGRLLIQTRSVLLTFEALDAADRFLAARTATTPLGILAVVNGDAGVLPEAVRIKQLAYVSRMLGGGAWMATVTYGDTVNASTMRAMGRMMLLRQPRLGHHPDVASAAASLATPLGLRSEDIVAAVARQQRGEIPPIR